MILIQKQLNNNIKIIFTIMNENKIRQIVREEIRIFKVECEPIELKEKCGGNCLDPSDYYLCQNDEITTKSNEQRKTEGKAIKIPDWIEVYRHNTFDMVVYSWNRLYFKKKNEEYGHDERIEFGTFAGSAISSDKLTHFIPHEGELEVGRCYVAKLGDSNEIGMYYVYSGRSANSDVFAFFTEKYHRIVFDLIHMPKGAEYLKPVTEQEAIDLGYDV